MITGRDFFPLPSFQRQCASVTMPDADLRGSVSTWLCNQLSKGTEGEVLDVHWLRLTLP